MGGRIAIVALLDFGFMGGSMGTAVGEGLVMAADLAVARKAPLIVFSASGGARMQEGILSLMQLTRTTIAVRKVKEAGLPYIVVLTDPTTGGVSASFAMLGDVHIAEPDAIIGFAGPRVIQDTIRQELPAGFQRSEYLLEHGMVDAVVHRHKLRETLIRLVSLLHGSRCRPRAAAWLSRSAELRRRRSSHDRCRSSSASCGCIPKLIDLGLERIERLLADARLAATEAAAGGPCRRHQRQGLAGRLSARHGRRRRAIASMSTPRRIWCASTSASASPAS